MRVQRVLKAARWAAVATVAMTVLPAAADAAGGQVLLSDPFGGATTTARLVAHADPLAAGAGLPCLTAGSDRKALPIPGCALGVPDAPGHGRLRMSTVDRGEAVGVVYDSSFPTSAGLDVQFEQYQWGSSDYAGDGIGFVLAAAPPTPSNVGQYGGQMGYATDGSYPGFPGGYLGVALDVFGNNANVSFGDRTCATPVWGRRSLANTVTVRGPGNGTTGYCPIANSSTGGPLEGPLHTSGPDGGRTVHVVIDPDAGRYSVSLDYHQGGPARTVAAGPLPDSYYTADGQRHDGVPPRLTFAFTAASGGARDYHEIADVSAATQSGFVPVLTLANTDDTGGVVTKGETFNYRLQPGVDAASPAAEKEPATVKVTDQLPAGVSLHGTPQGEGWDCLATAGNAVSCTYAGTQTAVAPGEQLPPITVPVAVAADAPGTSLTSTATVTSLDAAGPVSTPLTTALRRYSQVTWPDPAPITYGTPLGDAQLNATADVAGTFVYTPAAGTLLHAGTYTLSATFTPDDTVHYLPATKTVTLVVQPTATTLTAAPATIVGLPATLATPTATLKAAGTDAPLPGKTITFTAGGTSLCTATTDTAGVASCPSTPASLLPSLLSGGYTATFAGDGDALRSTAQGATVSLLGLIHL